MYFSYAKFNTKLDFLKDVCLLAVFNVLKCKTAFLSYIQCYTAGCSY